MGEIRKVSAGPIFELLETIDFGMVSYLCFYFWYVYKMIENNNK